MYRLSYVLLQGFFLFAIHDEFILHNGVIHQADAKIKVKYTCQYDVMNLHCQSPKAITIYRAEYSRKQDSICNRGNSAEYCDPVDKTSLVRKHCEGQMTCNISVDKSTMGDKCPTVFKYLNVLYECNRFHVAVRLFSNRSQKTSKCETLPPSTEPPYVRNKSTMVLTRPSTPSISPNKSTGNLTELVFCSSSTEGIQNEEESTSVVYGFVLYNGESVYTISDGLVALILALAIFL